MKKYVHLKCGLRDKGKIVNLDEVHTHVDDQKKDWYTSAYYYEEEVLDYFKNNKNSIAGYKGKGFTNSLHWDIDNTDFEAARRDAIQLVEHLKYLNYGKGIEIFFSGNKGFHVYLRVSDTITNEQSSSICQKIANAAGSKIDPVVYNKTRAFRLSNTRHQKSKLYKVQLSIDELFDDKESNIKHLAEELQELFPANSVSVKKLIDEYEELSKTIPKQDANLINLDNYRPLSNELNMSKCPPGMRRCMYRLENGYFGPGERENALHRIAAYYRGQGKDKEFAYSILNVALEKRARLYPTAEAVENKDTIRILNHIYNESFQGGTYSCKGDIFLQNHCDQGKGCKAFEKTKDDEEIKYYMTVKELGNLYLKDSDEALAEYPKTGIKWLDDRIHIRPKNYSVINGANGSGKTSLVIKIMENL